MTFRPVRVTLLWTAGLVAVALLPAIAGPRVGQAPLWFRLVYLAVGGAGSLLPFAAAAGGLAAVGETRARLLRVNALTIGVLTYAVASYATPLLEAKVLGYGDTAITDVLPFGPTTPENLVEWRNAVLADGPNAYSFRVEEPFRRPPNWLAFQLYLPVALSTFAYLNFFLGKAIGTLTRRLPDPRRSYLSWAAALAWSLGYFAVVNLGRVWGRSAPTHSAVLGAFLPLLIPVGLVAIHRLLLDRRSPGGGGG